jgi:putative ABC transport system substrate-binding protein
VLGILSPNQRPTPEEWNRLPATVQLARFGWIAGRTLAIEYAYAGGKEALLRDLATELVKKHVDVIWARGPEAAIAAARATKTIPIVFTAVAWPVEMGLADSLARPGRNSTGIAWTAGDSESVAKPVEFLRAIAPGIKRIVSIWSTHNLRTISDEEYTGAYPGFETAIRKLGFDYRFVNVNRPEDYDVAFGDIMSSKTEAIIALSTPLNFRERKRIVDFATRERLASVFDARPFVELGGLVSYGVDIVNLSVQSVHHLDRILRGTKPSDLAIELPSRYELAVNTKAASSLGLKIPNSILLRADRVIE